MNQKLLLFFSFFASTFISAQSPEGINFQGIARDSIGHPLVNTIISFRLSIIDSSATGQTLYVETQNTTTNNSGLFNLNIGNGNILSGVFGDINWGKNKKWLKIEMDNGGGNNYHFIGTTQFLSVPYAIHANYADSVSSHPLTIQERLNAGETPKHIYDSGVSLDFLIGKIYAGGIIFFLDLNTGHGLVAATQDQSLSSNWSTVTNVFLNVTATAIGTGQSNTSAIVASQGPGNYAAYLCDTLTLNGYSDWYLPSLNEIIQMDNVINPPYFLVSGYWSSTEYDLFQAWFLFDNNGYYNRPKSNLYGVHAIRSF